MANEFVQQQLAKSFAELQAYTNGTCSSLLKKYLTWQVFEKLRHQQTKSGATLLDIIQSGIRNPDSSIGVYAPDVESYTLFASLLDPIIEEYHHHKLSRNLPPARNFGNPESFTNLDPTGQFILSTRIRCARTLTGYPMHPQMSKSQYQETEAKIRTACTHLPADLAGEYTPLAAIDPSTQRHLIDAHLLSHPPDRFLRAAHADNSWPLGRGLFLNRSRTFVVWVNEEDHLRIISMAAGSDLRAIYARFVRGVRLLETELACCRDPRVGYVTFCPTNVGTTVRASVLVRLPALAARRERLREVAERYRLQVRGTHGEHSEDVDGVFDVSNQRRLGLTEFEAVREMEVGVMKLIEVERSLSANGSGGI